MSASACVEHRSPGRLRIRVSGPDRKLLLRALAEDLKGCPGLLELSVNESTGGILLRYSGGEGPVLDYAKERGVKPAARGRATGALRGLTLQKGVRGGYSALNRKVIGLSHGTIDIGGIAFLSLLALGGLQISRGNFAAPAWYTAFWYALNIFLKSPADLKDEEGDAGDDGAGE